MRLGSKHYKALVAGLVVLLLVAGVYYGYTRVFGFGAADYTEFTLQAESVSQDEIPENRTVTVVERSNLSQRERSILAEAIQNRYRVRKHRYYGQIPAAFNGVLAACALPPRAELTEQHRSKAISYIRYNGSAYRVTVLQRNTYA